MCNREIADHLKYYDDMSAPPPPSVRDDLEILAERRRVAEQAEAAAANVGKPDEKIRSATARALHLHWLTVPW